MTHRLAGEADAVCVSGFRMTPAERAAGRWMRAPDHRAADDPVRRIEALLAREEAAADAGDDPIAAPVSWGEDAQDLFAQLPPELQRQVAEREAAREKSVQAAQTALAGEQHHYGQAVRQLAVAFRPSPPDPAIAAQDSGRYMALRAQHDHQIARHHALMQRAMQAQHQADQRDAFVHQSNKARDREALARHFGVDWSDPGQRQAMIASLAKVAEALGYTDLGKVDAQDMLAFERAAA
jgi:hypothetical protein